MKHLRIFLLMCVACAATGWGYAQNITSSEVKFRYQHAYSSEYYLSEASTYGDVCFMIDNVNNTSTTFGIEPVGNGRYLIKAGTRYLFANDKKGWGTAFYTDAFDEANGYFSGEDMNQRKILAVNAVRQDDALYVLGDEQVTDYSKLDELAQAGTVKKIDLLQVNNFVFSFSKYGILDGNAAYSVISEIGARIGINGADGMAITQGITANIDSGSLFFMENENNFDPDRPNYDGQFGENIHWELKDGTLTVSGTGTMSDSDTPAPWTLYKNFITDIVITNGITTVRESEFFEYANLVSVTLPESLVSIGTYAFAGPSQLTSVTVNWTATQDLPAMGGNVFIFIPSSAVLHVPAGSESIYTGSKWNSFFSSINGFLRWNCGPGGSASVTATLSNGTLTISGSGNMADYNSSDAPWYSYKDDITAAVIEDGVTGIGQAAFWGCQNLASVSIPASVTSIGGQMAFAYCRSLASITIPEGVTTIGQNAFIGCSSLTAVHIPASVTAIEAGPFENCPGLNTITVEAGNAYYSADGGVLFNQDKTRLVQYPGGKSGSYTIPDGVTDIEIYAFATCTNLTAFTVPASVINIGSHAFENCSSLAAVHIPATVKSIGSGAFNRCFGLTGFTVAGESTSYFAEDGVLFNRAKNVLMVYPAGKTGAYVIPNSVTAIENFSSNPNLTSVTIPNTALDIRSSAFSNCHNLASVICLAPMPPSLEEYAFAGIDPGCTLMVPEGSESVYSSNSAWNSYFSSISSIPPTWNCGPGGSSSVTATLSGGTLTISGTGDMEDYEHPISAPWDSYKNSIIAAVIENGVTSIGKSAFYECRNLASIIIPDGMTKIGMGAFSECYSLTSITLPADLISIDVDAFYQCHSLTSITIPGSVVSLRESAFRFCSSLTEIIVEPTNTAYSSWDGVLFDKNKTVLITYPAGKTGTYTIPGSVTNISPYAFLYCLNLTGIAVEVGNTTYSSEDGVLFNNVMDALIAYPAGKTGGTYTTPHSVTSIGNNAFSYCSNLTSVTLFNSAISSIGNDAFWGCSNLTSVISISSVPPSLLGSNVFYGIASGCTLAVPANSESTYGNSAWNNYFSSISGLPIWNCGPGESSLVIAMLSNGTLTISGTGDMEDYLSSDQVPWDSYKNSITAAVVENGVTSIKRYAFHNCHNLTSVIIPNSVTYIGEYAFFDCYSLTSITLPAGLTDIYAGAFYRCGLTSVTIPSSVIILKYGAFMDCSSLTDIIVETGNTNFSSEDGVLFDKNKTVLMAYPAGKTGAYTVPGSVTNIAQYAFFRCLNLTDITVAAENTSLSSEGGVLFSKDMTALIAYPAGKTGAYIIPNNVTSIGNDAFACCNGLTSITIPNSVTNIGNDAFWECFGLTSVTCLATTPPSLTGWYVFNGIDPGCTLAVPAGSESAYAGSAWSSYFSFITGILTWNCGSGGSASVIAKLSSGGTFTVFGTGDMEDYLYTTVPWESYRNSITSAVIENGVTGIGDRAFTDCRNLTSVTISNDVTAIGDSTFAGCEHLTTITIPAGVTVIEDYVFQSCFDLASITIPGNVTDIKEGAFWSCTGLTSVTIPESVTSIESYAFSGCTQLNDLTVNWATPLSVPDDVFNGVSVSTCTLHVPAGSEALYKAAPVWEDFSYPVNASLSVSPSSLDFTVAGGSQTVDILSNVAWTVVCMEPWITIPVTAGSGNGTITVTATANSGNVFRTATITVSVSGIDRTITVTQGTPELSVSTPSLDFTATGGSQTLDISSNVEWTVTSTEPWVTIPVTWGSGNGTVTVTVTPNSDYVSRTATVEISASGITRTIDILQEGTPAPASLTVSPSSFDFATAGGSQEVDVVSNRTWTAVSDAPWLTVTQVSGSVLRIAAMANTGYARMDSVTVTADGLTQLIYVTQDAAQQIIAEPTPPANNQGTIQIALEIPVNEQFSITFTVTLPAGFTLDQQATSLVSGLLSSYRLSVTPNGQGGWLFEITPALSLSSLRIGEETNYRELVNIVYTLQKGIQSGDYEVKIQDVDLTVSNGEVIHQDEINVPVRVGNDVGNATVAVTDVRYFNSRLYVNTPVAERITVYSLTGTAVYQSRKAEGAATFDLHSLPKGILIIRGESGWTRKVYSE